VSGGNVPHTPLTQKQENPTSPKSSTHTSNHTQIDDFTQTHVAPRNLLTRSISKLLTHTATRNCFNIVHFNILLFVYNMCSYQFSQIYPTSIVLDSEAASLIRRNNFHSEF